MMINEAFYDKDFLKLHLLDTERLLELVKDHPIMSKSLRIRIEAIKEALEELTNKTNQHDIPN